jgi:hypothetical protein
VPNPNITIRNFCIAVGGVQLRGALRRAALRGGHGPGGAGGDPTLVHHASCNVGPSCGMQRGSIMRHATWVHHASCNVGPSCVMHHLVHGAVHGRLRRRHRRRQRHAREPAQPRHALLDVEAACRVRCQVSPLPVSPTGSIPKQLGLGLRTPRTGTWRRASPA